MKTSMNTVVFFGYGVLGLNCLRRLLEEDYNVKYIFTHKDKTEEAVDTFAEQKEIPFSYVDLRKGKEKYTQYFTDLYFIISVNYRYIIPNSIIKSITYPVNIHGSLLPKYRGRTPHVWAIIHGQKVTGITAHIMDASVDTGKIIHQEEILINSDDTGYTLLLKLQERYPDILILSLQKIKSGVELIVQNDKEANYFGKRIPEMGYIDFFKYSDEIINFVRAQAEPYPGAYYYLQDGKKVIINQLQKTNIDDNLTKEIGTVVNRDDKYYVRAKDCTLELKNYRIVT